MNKNAIITLALAALPLCATAQHIKYTPATSVLADTIAGRNGSVDIIGEGRMNKGLVINSLDAIAGQAAGVVTTGDNRMAMINSVRVRGTTSLTGGNDPLVIIDGVYSDIATLSTIYPADIESFAILKNARRVAPCDPDLRCLPLPVEVRHGRHPLAGARHHADARRVQPLRHRV